ncbi:MAG: heme exporter protein CcmD [Roseovarius sp.]
MPDLGKYADTVLAAYAVSILLIIVLVVASLWRSKSVKAQLQAAEQKAKTR